MLGKLATWAVGLAAIGLVCSQTPRFLPFAIAMPASFIIGIFGGIILSHVTNSN